MFPPDVIILFATKTIFPLTEGFEYLSENGRIICAVSEFKTNKVKTTKGNSGFIGLEFRVKTL